MDLGRIAVIGAGNMGAGIAQAFAQAGHEVRLHDADEAAIARAIERIEGPLRRRVEAGKMKGEHVDGIMERLIPSASFDDALDGAGLAVEAVFEDLQVKKDLFARLDAAAAPDTLLATNTSSFYVRDVAAATKRPDRVLGLHFFFPANINKLVEVVRGPETDDAAFDAVFDVMAKAGKIPIETADAPGFCVNRFFVPWINEACRLLDDGHSVASIEAAAKSAFGIGMGPFELMNVTGVPISLHAQTTLHNELGAFYEPAPRLRAQVESGEQWDLLGEADTSLADAVAMRLKGVVFGIACHVVEAGVASVRDTDRGALTGLRWMRGPFRMMNDDLAGALAAVEALHDTWGEAFPMPSMLADAAKGDGFHIPTLTLQLDGHVATITFDRPEALNALDANVLRDLDAALDEIEASDARIVVVTGSGKAFVAGADIPTMKALDVAGADAYTRLGHCVLDRIAGLPQPVLMAINGFCLGGGLELALAGDVLVASEAAKLGLPEVGLGIHPGFGGTQRLPRRVGIGRAKELVLSGRTVGASEAAEVGLVDLVVPAGDLMGVVREMAASMARHAPLAMAGAKRVMDAGSGLPLADALALERESVTLLFASADKDEGLQAFLDHRQAKFTGK